MYSRATGFGLLMIVAGVFFQFGCISSAVMDTGRALEEGERETTSGFLAGWQREGMVHYGEPTVDGAGSPGMSEGSYPPYQQQLEWMVRSMRGVGGGVQVDLAVIAPTPLGIGLETGMKWQLPVGGEWFALAVAARGGGNFGGFGGLDEGVAFVGGHLDGGMIASLHLPRQHALYVSPRGRLDGVYHRVWSDGVARGATGRGWSWGGATGVKIGSVGRVEQFVEAVVLHSPNPDGEDGIRVTFGLGARGDPAHVGYLPW